MFSAEAGTCGRVNTTGAGRERTGYAISAPAHTQHVSPPPPGRGGGEGECVCRTPRVSDADGTACCGAQNSSLVLTADSRSSRGQNEGTGEPETLWGRINPKGFGDRAGAGKKEDLEEMKTKAKSKCDPPRCVPLPPLPSPRVLCCVAPPPPATCLLPRSLHAPPRSRKLTALWRASGARGRSESPRTAWRRCHASARRCVGSPGVGPALCVDRTRAILPALGVGFYLP
jgi:hypothetical protein